MGVASRLRASGVIQITVNNLQLIYDLSAPLYCIFDKPCYLKCVYMYWLLTNSMISLHVCKTDNLHSSNNDSSETFFFCLIVNYKRYSEITHGIKPYIDKSFLSSCTHGMVFQCVSFLPTNTTHKVVFYGKN